MTIPIIDAIGLIDTASAIKQPSNEGLRVALCTLFWVVVGLRKDVRVIRVLPCLLFVRAGAN